PPSTAHPPAASTTCPHTTPSAQQTECASVSECTSAEPTKRDGQARNELPVPRHEAEQWSREQTDAAGADEEPEDDEQEPGEDGAAQHRHDAVDHQDHCDEPQDEGHRRFL